MWEKTARVKFWLWQQVNDDFLNNSGLTLFVRIKFNVCRSILCLSCFISFVQKRAAWKRAASSMPNWCSPLGLNLFCFAILSMYRAFHSHDASFWISLSKNQINSYQRVLYVCNFVINENNFQNVNKKLLFSKNSFFIVSWKFGIRNDIHQCHEG